MNWWLSLLFFIGSVAMVTIGSMAIWSQNHSSQKFGSISNIPKGGAIAMVVIGVIFLAPAVLTILF